MPATDTDPPLRPDDPVDALRGVGPARRRALEAAGFHTVQDLLEHLPRDWQDRRHVRTVSQALELLNEAGQREGPGDDPPTVPGVTLEGELTGLRAIRTRRRGLTLVRGRLQDDAGDRLAVLWFNRPYLARRLPAGCLVRLHGKLRQGRGGPELLNPEVERLEPGGDEMGEAGGGLVPVYPAAGDLAAGWLGRLVQQAVTRVDLAGLPDPLPAPLRRRHGLPSLGRALEALHRPPADADGDAFRRRDSAEFHRWIYGELLALQLDLAIRRARRRRRRAPAMAVDEAIRRVCRDVLPFRLTSAQRRCLKEIVDDLVADEPMQRLLQGDVGSGKTVVAALALVVALENGCQGALMAPTELLAEQHFASLRRLLGERYRIALWTASSSEPAALAADVARGRVQLVVGTHALIQESVRFRRLGLAVVDEQHRFGVEQRRRLMTQGGGGGGRGEGELPNLLVMTATPIPRSLALTAYGDLDFSLIDELPPGRRPVTTEVHPAGERRRVYRRLAAELGTGEGADKPRAYVVFPLIEDSDQVAAASLESRGEEVRRWLAQVPAAVVHGRLERQERDRTMAAFAAGRVRLLIATTVIEVGVDVPEATVMVIESAERFGLAQLHQLRGRVGRGRRPSRCIAFHGSLGEAAGRRLEVFARTTDGFEIAEEDLRQRGPGDVLGTLQAGAPGLRLADPVRHTRWLQRAREDARRLLPRLDEPRLAALAARLGRPRGRPEERLEERQEERGEEP